MNCLSLNVRGLGDCDKVEWVNSIIRNHRINFVGIQETQLMNVAHIDLVGWWGNNNFNFEYVDSVGRSGGLLSMWNPSLFSVDNVVKARNFIAVSGKWMDFPGTTTLVNVYAPQFVADKRILLADLLNLKRSLDGIWVFFGDFNAVRREDERMKDSIQISVSTLLLISILLSGKLILKSFGLVA